MQLKHGKKIIYTRHQKFLKLYHPYRQLNQAFNGEAENEIAPKPLTGNEVYERLEKILIVFGKTQKKDASEKNIWKKRSIFFDLPYWSILDVRHCINVMHVEKSVCDSLIYTLLNIKGKTNDCLKACQDLVDMDIRQQIHLRSDGQQTYFCPPTCHTLLRNEKISFS